MPIVPVRNGPVPLPAGGSENRNIAVAKSDTPQGRTPEATPVDGNSVETTASKTVVTRTETSKRETQGSQSLPGRRPRPARSVARKG